MQSMASQTYPKNPKDMVMAHFGNLGCKPNNKPDMDYKCFFWLKLFNYIKLLGLPSARQTFSNQPCHEWLGE